MPMDTSPEMFESTPRERVEFSDYTFESPYVEGRQEVIVIWVMPHEKKNEKTGQISFSWRFSLGLKPLKEGDKGRSFDAYVKNFSAQHRSILDAIAPEWLARPGKYDERDLSGRRFIADIVTETDPNGHYAPKPKIPLRANDKDDSDWYALWRYDASYLPKQEEPAAQPAPVAPTGAASGVDDDIPF